MFSSSLVAASLLALAPGHSTPAAPGSSAGADAAMPAAAILPGQPSAQAALLYLAKVMDQYHDRFPVYDDVSSGGNHFFAWSKIPDQNAAVTINGSWTDNPHSGATAVRAEFDNTTGTNFGGFYFLNGVLPAGATAPLPNFGDVANAGIDLTGATALTFWARGQQGGERISFFLGGVGRDPNTGQPTAPFPDSTPVVKRTVTLTTAWTQYSFDLHGLDLHYVLGGFGWIASAVDNPSGAVFFLDDISYALSDAARAARLGLPRFLRSFTTEPVQSLPDPVGTFDLAFREVANTYDNALAIIAFLADGSADSIRRARLIGDAFVYAAEHDRFYDDGRLRDSYAAGDLVIAPGWTPNGRTATVTIPGYFDEARQVFVEFGQDGMSTGNEAWAMLALLTLQRETGDRRYLTPARRLGTFVVGFRNDQGLYQGFLGGLDHPEAAAPVRRPWASTEHNLDLYAAFALLAGVDPAGGWAAQRDHARQFVDAMWDAALGCNLTGTTDPQTRNASPGQLPEDAQSWAVLALPDALTVHPELLTCAERNFLTTDAGFRGFDFNDDKDGVWFEGTAHMATAYLRAGRSADADIYLATLARAQSTPPFGDGMGIAAASRDGLTTGFGFFYFRRLYVGATAWNVLAQLGWNPYTIGPAAAPCTADAVTLCLAGNRFEVRVTWEKPLGATGEGQAFPLTTDTGAFWFFDSGNVELLVKVLDGCAINGAHWVFAGGLTNVKTTLTVVDGATGATRTYLNPQRTPFQPLQDTRAFPSCP
jgi:hypothetical protein